MSTGELIVILVIGFGIIGFALKIIVDIIFIDINAAEARKKAKQQESKSNDFWDYIDD